MSVEQGEWNPFLYSQILSRSLSHRPPCPKSALEEEARVVSIARQAGL